MAGRRSWVLLRGLGREAAHWDGFLDAFRAAFPDDRVLTPDLPGAGRSREVTCPLSLAEITDFVRRESGATPRAHLLAISLGGMVALDWAQRYPEEVGGLVLINASAGSLSSLFERLRPQAWPQVLRAITQRDALAREKIVMGFNSNLRACEETLARRFAAISRARPVGRLNLIRQLMAAARFRPEEDKPRAPGLVLISARDGMVNPECSRAIARKWGFQAVEHPTAGHDLPLDDGPWVVRQVHAWQENIVARARKRDPGKDHR